MSLSFCSEHYISSILSGFFSIILPLFIVALRESIKRQRQCLIYELEAVYFNVKNANDASQTNTEFNAVYPAFEFVKYKYTTKGIEGRPKPREISVFTYFLSALPLSIILIILGYYAFTPITRFLSGDLGQNGEARTIFTRDILWTVGYIGTYLYTLKYLLVSAENFDLTPLSFIAAAVNVLIGVSAVLVLVMSIDVFLPEAVDSAIAVAVFVLGLFLVGYVPGLGLRTIMHYANFRLFKKFDAEAYTQHLSTPVEVIDGIDSNIGDRLSRFNIYSIQNLATVNPVMLFVETPYGIFAILDWVSQAQLCCFVGRKKLERLWTLGIRTIFDLKTALVAPNPSMAPAIAKILFTDEATGDWLPGVDPTTAWSKGLQEYAAFVFDDLHVYRLHQVWLFLGDRLGRPRDK